VRKDFSLAPPRKPFHLQYGAMQEETSLIFCHCLHVQHTHGSIRIKTYHALCNPVKDPDAETTPGLCSPDNRDQVHCGHEQLCHWGEERGLCQLLSSKNIASQPIYSAILTAMQDTLPGCPTWRTQLAVKEGEEQQSNGNHDT